MSNTFPAVEDSAKYLNSTFDASKIAIAIIAIAGFGLAGFVLHTTFMFYLFFACYGVAAILGVMDYLNKEEHDFSSFIDAMAKRTLPIVAVGLAWRFGSNPIFMVSSVLFSLQALMKAAQPDMSWRDSIINLLPVLLLAMSLSVVFNIHGIADFIPFPVFKGAAFLCFFMFLGCYELKDNKIAWGTFNLAAWPKFLLAFSLQFLFICAINLDPAVISVLTSMPIAQYLTYMVFMIPMVFNQTFAEEFICRSSILYLKDQLGDWDPYHIGYGVLCVAGSLLFALGHFSYFQNSFIGLMYCFSRYLTVAVAWMALAAYSDGIEYSAGIHFGNNLAWCLLFPVVLAINGGLTITWPAVLTTLLLVCVYTSVAFVPLMLCEKYFSPKLASDDILNPAVAKHENVLDVELGASNNGQAGFPVAANV
ncbi:MAG: hypothetical protein HON55_01855 [Legionellales bacterium]|jgi:hypothetical protein|nr:hypothetical protein [Legionellales bacterium]